MKALILNGSPRMERSNTFQITKSFVEGFPSYWEIETVHLYKLNIKPCMGCFSCWTKTLGKCVINDDMQTLYPKIAAADIIIESFPLYFFGIPSGAKAATDRCLPFMMPYHGNLAKDKQASFHELRDNTMHNKKLVLVSTCGFVHTEPMYPALLKQYDLICGEGNYTAVLCPEGEIFGYDMAQRQRKAYLNDVKKAGEEFAENGKITPETLQKLSKPLLSPSTFETVTKSHW